MMQIKPRVSNKTSLRTILVISAIGVVLAGVVGTIIFFALNVGRNEDAKAATYFNSNSDGNWTSPSSWGGSAPPVSTSQDTYFTINNYITRAGSLSFAKENGLTINSGATLEVTGSFAIQKSLSMNIDGTLIIWGALDVDKEAILTVNGNGNIVVYGPATLGKETNFMINGVVDFKDDLSLEKDATVTLNSGGELNVGGTLSFDQGAVISNNGTINVTEDLTFSSNPDQFNGSGTVNIGGTGCSYWEGSGSCAENSTLPVELLAFDAEFANNQVILIWKTATELNNDYFTIERSGDGTEFHSIGDVTGNGTTNMVSDYEYIDTKPLSGTTYYRLKQTDFDGTTETFRPVYVETTQLEENNTVTVYPNPFTGKELHIKLERPVEGTVELLDQNGTLVYQTSMDGYNSELSMWLDQDLPPGLYLLSIKSETLNKSIKIVKR